MPTDPPCPDPTDLFSQRRDYTEGRLLESDCPTSPWPLFERWLSEALHQQIIDATAMALATSDPRGQPSVRTVLLKQWGPEGFVFFTGYDSRKGKDLQNNPRAGLQLHWRELSRQVVIEATVRRLDTAASQAYFSQRPRESQLAASATQTPAKLPDRAALDALYEAEKHRWKDAEVPRPTNWGGYVAVPHRMEFWQGRESRLHDRIVYQNESPDAGCANCWDRFRLTP